MCKFFFNIFIVFYFVGILNGAVSTEERLPTLDNETMEASFGMSTYHSATMRGRIGWFHDDGDTWTAAALEEYFITGIFQHYVYELCRLDMTFDYEAHKASVDHIEKLAGLSKKVLEIDSDSAELNCELASLLNIVAAELKKNPIFVGLGICFHRNKIILEKKEEALRYIPKTPKGMVVREKKVAEILEIDRLTIDQQTAFYHWMKENIEQSMSYIRDFYKGFGKLPDLDSKDLLELANHQPEFMTWPSYTRLVPLAKSEKLGEICAAG